MPRPKELIDALGCHNYATMEMHLDSMIVRAWRP